jgi:serine/threonine protein kinase
LPTALPEDLQDLLLHMLATDPNKRFSVVEAQRHRYFPADHGFVLVARRRTAVLCSAFRFSRRSHAREEFRVPLPVDEGNPLHGLSRLGQGNRKALRECHGVYVCVCVCVCACVCVCVCVCV